MVDYFQNSFEIPLEDDVPFERIREILNNLHQTLLNIWDVRLNTHVSLIPAVYCRVWQETDALISSVMLKIPKIIRAAQQSDVREMKRFLEESTRNLDYLCEHKYNFDHTFITMACIEEGDSDEDRVSDDDGTKVVKNIKFKDSPRPMYLSCPICCLKFRPDHLMSELPCSHNFHQTCLEQWLRGRVNCKCPCCRFDLRGYALEVFYARDDAGKKSITCTPSAM